VAAADAPAVVADTVGTVPKGEVAAADAAPVTDAALADPFRKAAPNSGGGL
jgi:hypothetical protein